MFGQYYNWPKEKDQKKKLGIRGQKETDPKHKTILARKTRIVDKSDDPAAQFLEKDYIEMVEEHPMEDSKKTTNQIHEEIYAAVKKKGIQDQRAIKVRFGHSDTLSFAQKHKLRKNQTLEAPPPINPIKVASMMRSKHLTAAFAGTWVTAGMDKYVNDGGLAANLKEADYAFNQEEIKQKALEWMNEQNARKKFAANLYEPNINMGNYFNSFCDGNKEAFLAYKKLGMNKTADIELKRFTEKQKKQVDEMEKESELQRLLEPKPQLTVNEQNKRDQQLALQKVEEESRMDSTISSVEQAFVHDMYKRRKEDLEKTKKARLQKYETKKPKITEWNCRPTKVLMNLMSMSEKAKKDPKFKRIKKSPDINIALSRPRFKQQDLDRMLTHSKTSILMNKMEKALSSRSNSSRHSSRLENSPTLKSERRPKRTQTFIPMPSADVVNEEPDEHMESQAQLVQQPERRTSTAQPYLGGDLTSRTSPGLTRISDVSERASVLECKIPFTADGQAYNPINKTQTTPRSRIKQQYPSQHSVNVRDEQQLRPRRFPDSQPTESDDDLTGFSEHIWKKINTSNDNAHLLKGSACITDRTSPQVSTIPTSVKVQSKEPSIICSGKTLVQKESSKKQKKASSKPRTNVFGTPDSVERTLKAKNGLQLFQFKSKFDMKGLTDYVNHKVSPRNVPKYGITAGTTLDQSMLSNTKNSSIMGSTNASFFITRDKSPKPKQTSPIRAGYFQKKHASVTYPQRPQILTNHKSLTSKKSDYQSMSLNSKFIQGQSLFSEMKMKSSQISSAIHTTRDKKNNFFDKTPGLKVSSANQEQRHAVKTPNSSTVGGSVLSPVKVNRVVFKNHMADISGNRVVSPATLTDVSAISGGGIVSPSSRQSSEHQKMLRRPKEVMANWHIIKQCDKEKKEFLVENPARDYDILQAAEDYRYDEFLRANNILKEIENFQPQILKQMFNSKMTFAMEQEQMSRETIYHYKSGIGDPNRLAAQLEKQDHINMKARKSGIPKVSKPPETKAEKAAKQNLKNSAR